jgi:DAACS family dicarboxylate/amino acid:cation (Na+ or H+) symporter
VVRVLEVLFAVSMKVIGFAMAIAPVGVGALLFKLTASFGFDVLAQLAAFAGVVLLALAILQFGTYSLVLKLVARTSPIAFFRAIREAMVIAFATSSSNATLPTALRVADDNLRMRKDISRFVLTAGATGNQHGTALYEGVTILFLAQVYLGHGLPVADQLYVLGAAILAGIGTAGVPSGSIPFIAMICPSVGVPAEAVGLILGVDRILDMCRTVTNVTGDLVAATYVEKSEERRLPSLDPVPLASPEAPV